MFTLYNCPLAYMWNVIVIFNLVFKWQAKYSRYKLSCLLQCFNRNEKKYHSRVGNIDYIEMVNKIQKYHDLKFELPVMMISENQVQHKTWNE